MVIFLWIFFYSYYFNMVCLVYYVIRKCKLYVWIFFVKYNIFVVYFFWKKSCIFVGFVKCNFYFFLFYEVFWFCKYNFKIVIIFVIKICVCYVKCFINFNYVWVFNFFFFLVVFCNYYRFVKFVKVNIVCWYSIFYGRYIFIIIFVRWDVCCFVN